MILSASRRTDIPGCYPSWFMNRIREKYVMTRNPMNYHQVSQIDLSPNSIDCIVFWTKNAMPIMRYLDELDNMGYIYMFQYTITPYDHTIERNIPSKKDIMANVVELSNRIGKQRLVWRYDPIFLNDKYTISQHIEFFNEMCSQLCDYVDHIVISFIDLYKKNRAYNFNELTENEVLRISQEFGVIGQKYRIQISTCCENYDLEPFGITKKGCIDAEFLEKICNRSLRLKKSTGQRKLCLCSESVDIGAYHTCTNGCTYCYATDYKRLQCKHTAFDANSPLLCDTINRDTDIIRIRNMQKL